MSGFFGPILFLIQAIIVNIFLKYLYVAKLQTSVHQLSSNLCINYSFYNVFRFHAKPCEHRGKSSVRITLAGTVHANKYSNCNQIYTKTINSNLLVNSLIVYDYQFTN